LFVVIGEEQLGTKTIVIGKEEEEELVVLLSL